MFLPLELRETSPPFHGLKKPWVTRELSREGHCYGLNYDSPKDVEVLTLSTCECEFIWK